MLRGLALKPGITSGSESFLSLSLDATAAALALSIASWSAKSTGGTKRGGVAGRGGSPSAPRSNCAMRALSVANSVARWSLMRA